MRYSIEDLKKQIIALDFSRKDYINNLSEIDLINYVGQYIIDIIDEVNKEILNLNNSELKKIDDLFNKVVNLNSNSKLPTLLSTLNLLNRIKNDLKN